MDELFPVVVTAEWDRAAANGWRVDGFDHYCPRCGVSLKFERADANGCGQCEKSKIAWQRLVRLSVYDEPMRGWLLSMKYGRRHRWCAKLGAELAVCVRGSGVMDTMPQVMRWAVCPVPMHPLRRWSRGYNQAGLLAEAMAGALGVPCVDLLRRSKHRRSQTSLTITQRRSNAKGSFASHDIDLTGWGVWLVDDVKTSGATLGECAKLLQKGNPAWLGVATAAVAMRHETA